MAKPQGVGPKKGNRKLGRNKTKCEHYRARHGGGTRKKIVGSKGHRGCGPLGYYMKYKAYLDSRYGSRNVIQDKGETHNTRIVVK